MDENESKMIDLMLGSKNMITFVRDVKTLRGISDYSVEIYEVNSVDAWKKSKDAISFDNSQKRILWLSSVKW